MEPLDEREIGCNFLAAVAHEIQSIDIFQRIDSTNSYLKRVCEQEGLPGVRVSLAEYQESGHGRRGNKWQADAGKHILFSMTWPVPGGAMFDSTFSLVVAIALLHVLQDLGVDGVKIKWPNDIYVKGKKIAGVMIEEGRKIADSRVMIIGIGVNVGSTKYDSLQGITDLEQEIGITARNHIVAMIINELFQLLRKYHLLGFNAFEGEWRQYDYLLGRVVKVEGAKIITGVSRGIDASGALMIESDAQVHHIFSGHILEIE